MIKIDDSSFRDPSGFVYFQNTKIFRVINQSYKDNYNQLISSGLYDLLTKSRLLITHKEIRKKLTGNEYKIITPVKIPFISYPYEWSFDQLKDAALATLKIQKLAISKGMSLKDATSFNIQFLDGKPILIDTLSFEKLDENKPWIAYRQFCEHFLAPLAIACNDVNLLKLLNPNTGLIPLSLASNLLSLKQKTNLGILIHILLHNHNQNKYQTNKLVRTDKNIMSKQALLAIIDSLETTIKSLKLTSKKTHWSEYGRDCSESYSDLAFTSKKRIVNKYLKIIKPKTVCDFGGNDGTFSRIAKDYGAFVVCADIDPFAVNRNYNQIKLNAEKNLLSLCVDLTNPTPAIGWNNQERKSFLDRLNPDTILALAIVHHLAITNNTPVERIAKLFNNHCKHLVIEFVPKEDPQTRSLLQSREDIFTDYTVEGFEKSFSKYFTIIKKSKISQSLRIVYLMRTKKNAAKDN